jgi:hypothetical protein
MTQDIDTNAWDELFRDIYAMGRADALLDTYDFEQLRPGIENKLTKLLEAEKLRARIDEAERCRNRDVNYSVGLALDIRIAKLKADLIKLEGK